MKQLIVLMAVLPLLMLFVLQFSMQEQRLYQITRAEEIASAACEQAKQDGYFTAENREAAAEALSRVFDVPAAEIQIESPWSIRYRTGGPAEMLERGMIPYEIGIPLKQIVAGASLVGMTPEQNKGVYVIAGQLPSERLMP